MLIFLLSAVYAICAFATMVVAYHRVINWGDRYEVQDEMVSVVVGVMWPIVWLGVALYTIVPAIKYVEKLIYQKK